MNEKELVRKADIALSDLATAGQLNVEQSNRFFRTMIDAPTIINQVRTVPMRSNSMEVNKIGFGSRILRAANQGTISSPLSGEEGTRALARANRVAPDLSKITLNTSEIIAEINLPYEVIEDNIEGGGGRIDSSQFEQTILDLLAGRAALDLEELLISGDEASGDTYLALQDGVLVNAVSNIVNQGGSPVDADFFASMIRSLPTKYHRLLGSFKFFTSVTKEIDYRMTVAQRQTALGDATLTGTSPVSVLGVGLNAAALMPNANVMLINPKNIIWGVQRNFRMEFDKDVRERVFIIVLTLRVAFDFEEEDMVVKGTNVG